MYVAGLYILFLFKQTDVPSLFKQTDVPSFVKQTEHIWFYPVSLNLEHKYNGVKKYEHGEIRFSFIVKSVKTKSIKVNKTTHCYVSCHKLNTSLSPSYTHIFTSKENKLPNSNNWQTRSNQPVNLHTLMMHECCLRIYMYITLSVRCMLLKVLTTVFFFLK